MKRTKPLISQIMTFHSEGVLAQFTLRSMIRVREYAATRKIPIEFVLVLDNADLLTTRIVKNHSLVGELDQVVEVSHGDPASSRNSGVNASRGEYLGILDGDDYCSANWPVAALETAKAMNALAVVHPELCVSFGASHTVQRIIDMTKDQFPLSACLSHNPWIVCSFGLKEIYINNPYQRTDAKLTGFGYEDWHWNIELISNGVKHVCVPRTAHFYRRKAESRLTSETAAGAILRPSSFFDKVELLLGKVSTGV